MDDLDKFLEESALSIPTGERTSSLDQDDDFLAFLDTPSTLPKGGSAANPANSVPPTSEDNQDFLEWLQDSPAKTTKTKTTSNITTTSTSTAPTPASEATARAVAHLAGNESFMLASKSLHVDHKDTSKASMDSFFNEVFGSGSPTASAKSHKFLSSDEYDDANNVDGQAPRTVEEKILSIVQSSFPDINLLRSVICSGGYIPSSLRAQVWSLLLTESSAEDEEVRHFSSESVDFANIQALVSDCKAVISSSNCLQPHSAEAEQCKKDMQDILVLYCQRRNFAYKSVLCRLLSPLLVVGAGAGAGAAAEVVQQQQQLHQEQRCSRVHASSCFYALASEFVPLINLQVRRRVIFKVIDVMK